MPRLGQGESEAERAVESIIRQVPGWSDRALSYEIAVVPIASPMQRGVDGDCWRIETDAGERFFLKIPHVESARFVDPLASVAASAIAGELDIAPRLVWSDPVRGTAIWDHLGDAWRTANLSDLAARDVMASLVAAKRAVHRGPHFGRTRSVFELAEAYAARAAAETIPMPDDHGWMLGNIRSIAAAIGAAGTDLAPCHGDGIASNVMIGAGDAIKLVDWDEAANADPFWDLGSLFAEAFPFDPAAQAALEHYYGRFDAGLFARCRLYGIVDDFAWGTRSLIAATQAKRRDLESFKYGQWRFLRCRMELHGRRFEQRLRAL